VTAPLDPDGVAAIVAAVRAGERSATAIVTDHLERIETAQPHINAFTLVTADAAVAAAERIDAAVAAGNDPGPLAGVPVAVKDIIDQVGLPTTCGAGFPAPPAAADAPAVARLVAAGAVVVGRTNLHEFAFGFSSENHWFGPVHNPWNTTLSPGGSSGGSAAAVAARLVPVALGTDTGGSVRVPAALCGIVGLKVTHGRVPLTGVFPLAASLDTVGPMARSVGDTTLLYAALAGHDPADPWSATRPVTLPGSPPPLAAVRLAVPHPWVDHPLAAEVAAGWTWFRNAVAAAGATVADIEIPEIDFPGMVSEAIYPEVAAVHRSRFAAAPDRYGPEVRRRVELAVDGDIDAYLEGLAWRRRMREAAITALRTADVLITPAVAATRKVIGVDTIEIDGESVPYRGPLSMFSALVNHMGLPALALPLDLDGAPPPAIQLIGRPWGEHKLLEIGAALERAGVSAVRTPPPPSAPLPGDRIADGERAAQA